MDSYNIFKYLYPPRPANAILPGLLSFYEKQKWIAQIKKNGACTLWAVSPDKEITVMNRHHDFHKTWTRTEEVSEPFMHLPKKWYVFTGELLHVKTPHIKDTFYIFDLLVSDSEYHVGRTFKERREHLDKLFTYQDQTSDSFKVNNKVLVAKNFDIGFENLYNQLTDIADEGLVLKDPNAKLSRCFKSTDNNTWQVKCRKAHKNYGF